MGGCVSLLISSGLSAYVGGSFLDSAPPREPGPPFCSSSDSDYDEEEPHKFYIRIKPVQPRDRSNSAAATAAMEQLKASVGNLILPPSVGVGIWWGGGPSGWLWGQAASWTLEGARERLRV